jgi:anti-sigma regulatory factor (Ser/Thr protein kinase)
LAEPDAPIAELHFALTNLGLVRRFVHEQAAAFGMDPVASAEFVLAVDEIATNSIRYGGGAGRLRVWCESNMIVCEITDRGHLCASDIERGPPTVDQPNGRGIWVACALSDQVHVHVDALGTVVRLERALRPDV